MKTLKNLTRLSLLLLIIAGLGACKKDKNDAPADTKSVYTFQGRTIQATHADYLKSDNKFNLFIYGEKATDIIKIVFFSKEIPTDGTYTTGGADRTKWIQFAVVNSATRPDPISSSDVAATITKADDRYKVTFDIGTNDGKASGTYNGVLVSR